MLTKIRILIKILSISVAVILLFTITSTDTSKVVIYPVSAQMDSNSNNNNATKSTMDLAMSELARIHLIAANQALMKGDTTAAFSQMNLAYLQFSMLEMKDMGRMNETQMMKFMQSGPEQSSSPSSSSASKLMVPENCIIIQGGVLQCRDILTGSYSLAK
jgi:choline-glycine betaine transporter